MKSIPNSKSNISQGQIFLGAMPQLHLDNNSMCVNNKNLIYFVKQFQRLAELSKTITVSAKWLCKYINIIIRLIIIAIQQFNPAYFVHKKRIIIHL